MLSGYKIVLIDIEIIWLYTISYSTCRINLSIILRCMHNPNPWNGSIWSKKYKCIHTLFYFKYTVHLNVL